MVVPAGAISQTPSPLVTATIAVTVSTRAAPLSAITAPITANGTVLEIRWSKPKCRNGALTISGSPSVVRGSMP